MTIFIDENIPYLSQALKSIANVITFNFKELTNEWLIKSKCQFLFTRSTIKVNSDLLDGTQVKFVGTSTIGTDHIDLDYLQKRKIHFCSAPGSNANSVAEYVVFAVLHWLIKNNYSPEDKTIGIVGFGNIGKLVQKHVEEIFPEMKILINDPPLKDNNFIFPKNVEYCELDELIKRSDIVTNHVPKEKNGKYPTINLFNENNLKLLKNKSLFIHSSRGGVVEETAILNEKRKKEIMLITDVWANEPFINRELLMRSEIATPHVAGHSWNGKIRGSIMMLMQFEEFTGLKVDLSEMKEYIRNSEKDFEIILDEFDANGNDNNDSVILNNAYQSYYQQADSMTREKSCYQLVDSMTEKRCHWQRSEESQDTSLNTTMRFFAALQNDRESNLNLQNDKESNSNNNEINKQLYEHLKNSRQIFLDTEELKTTIDFTEEERANKFNSMRRNYPKRFETLNYKC